MKFIIIDDYEKLAFLDITNMNAIELWDIINATRYGTEEDRRWFLYNIGYHSEGFDHEPRYLKLMTGITHHNATSEIKAAEQEKAKKLGELIKATEDPEDSCSPIRISVI